MRLLVFKQLANLSLPVREKIRELVPQNSQAPGGLCGQLPATSLPTTVKRRGRVNTGEISIKNGLRCTLSQRSEPFA